MMMKQVAIEYRYTLEEAVAASLEATKSVTRFYYVMPVIGVVIVIFNLISMTSGRQSVSDLSFSIGIGLVFAAMPIIARWSARRNARRLPSLNRLIKWQFTDSEIQQTSEGAEARFGWDRIIKIHERKHGFLLFPQPRLAHWLPKHGFQNNGDIETFRELAKSKSIPWKGRA